MPKIIAFIPARSQSTRIRNKNIRKLNGQPLIFWTYHQAKQSGIFSEIVMSTDSSEYEAIANGFGLKTIRRAFPTDALSPDIEWINQAMHRMKDFYPVYDYFAILRPTSPFRKPETIKRAWEQLQEFPEYDSLKALIECPITPYKIFEIKKVDERRQSMIPLLNDLPDAYTFPSNTFRSRTFGAQVGFLDICKWDNIEKYDNQFGNKIMPFFVDSLEAWDINTHLDFDIAEYLIDSRKVEL